MDRGDSGEEPLDDDSGHEPVPVPGNTADVDYWDVEEAVDLDAFDEVDGEAAYAVGVMNPDDPVAVDARNRERMAAALDIDLARSRRIAAEQAAQASTLARVAAEWACPHQRQIDTDPGEWVKDSQEWPRKDRHSDLPVSGIHEGLFGICLESIDAAAKVLAGERPSMTLVWARTQIENSIRVTKALPVTWAAWAHGELDARQVGVIVRCTRDVHDVALLAQVDVALSGSGETALALTRTWTTGALPPRITEILASLDIQVATETSRRRTASRSVKFFPEANGQARLVLEGPAPAVAEIYEAIKAAGLESKGEARRRNKAGLVSLDPWALTGIDDDHRDGRGIDAHRFDATHTLILGALTGLATSDSSEQKRSAPSSTTSTSLAVRWAALTGLASVQLPAVLVGLKTLLGADESPAQLDGYGPLSAWMARAMARYRKLRRFLTDPLTGELIHLDRHAYPPGYLNGVRPEDPDPPEDPGGEGVPGGSGPPSSGPKPPVPGGEDCRPLDPADCPVREIGGSGAYVPSPALAAFVRRRWGHCTAPGCRRRAAACDLDHTIPWPVGTTCACDLAPLCGTHHRGKHHSPHYGGGPSAAYAARSGTLPWKWQLYRCPQGHQHWTDPLSAENVVAPPPPLGTPIADDQKPRLNSPLTALTYPRPLPVLPPRAPAAPEPDPFDGPPPF